MRSDLQLEFKILRTLCDGPTRIRGNVLPKLKETHFSTATTANLYKRILKLHVTTDGIPSWSDLSHDPGVAKDTRKAMRKTKVNYMRTEDRATSVFTTLENLRQVRALFQLGANLEENLDTETGAIDIEKAIAKVQSDLAVVSKGAAETVVTRIGKNDTSHKVAKKILTKGGLKRIATGINAFDSINVGIPKSGVFILAANTGGGKSTLLDVVLEYMAMNGAAIAKVPLEMDAEENITRDMARITRESMTNLADPLNRISEKRRKEMYAQYKAHRKKMAARGGGIELVEPGFAANIENMLSYLDPLDYDVIAIDYVGLMDGVNGDDQWRALSNAVAYAKRYAGRPHKKTLIIFAAQITEEGYLKQSKAMADHCTNIWRWRVGEDERENGVVLVEQDKCRGGKVFKFPLKVDFEYMTFRDLNQKELQEWQLATRDAKKGEGGASWKSGNKDKMKRGKKKDLHDEEDDDDNEVVKIQPRKIKPRSKSFSYARTPSWRRTVRLKESVRIRA